jgi:hypothetical protein
VSVTVDTSDVRRLAVELGQVPARAVPALGVLVERAAKGIQDDLRRHARGHARFRSFPSSITYDIRGLAAEIGPDKSRRQGALGNLLYFGTAKAGPTLEHPGEALIRALPALEAGCAAVLEQAVTGGPVAAPAAVPRGRDARGRFV